jgi:hypothetical protein
MEFPMLKVAEKSKVRPYLGRVKSTERTHWAGDGINVGTAPPFGDALRMAFC